jgi:dienelactone hydrolase
MSRSRRRLWWGLGGLGVVALAGGLGVGGNVLSRFRGWTVETLDPAALSAKLAPYYQVTTPPGTGPFPTALLYSGCDGPKDNMARWSAALTARGWAAVVVDSHTPRGLGEHERWRLVCAGQVLMGSERAGDVLVSIADARRMPFVDPDAIVLIGSSHGGWAVMDLLALDPPHGMPTNLAAMPAGDGDPLAGVVGTVLLYPWCGPPNLARGDGWGRETPTLFLLSADDKIAPSGPCLEVAAELAARGVPVETKVFEGVTHGFDQQERAPLSTLEFDPEVTAEALEIGGRFLDGLGTAR